MARYEAVPAGVSASRTPNLRPVLRKGWLSALRPHCSGDWICAEIVFKRLL